MSDHVGDSVSATTSGKSVFTMAVLELRGEILTLVFSMLTSHMCTYDLIV